MIYIYRARGLGRKRATLLKKRVSCICPSLFRLHPRVLYIIVVFYIIYKRVSCICPSLFRLHPRVFYIIVVFYIVFRLHPPVFYIVVVFYIGTIFRTLITLCVILQYFIIILFGFKFFKFKIISSSSRSSSLRADAEKKTFLQILFLFPCCGLMQGASSFLNTKGGDAGKGCAGARIYSRAAARRILQVFVLKCKKNILLKCKRNS